MYRVKNTCQLDTFKMIVKRLRGEFSIEIDGGEKSHYWTKNKELLIYMSKHKLQLIITYMNKQKD